MATIAITGFSGLAGGCVGQALAARGHHIIGISRQPIAHLHGREVRSVPELRDEEAMATALRGCECVLHFADRADRRSYTEEIVGSAAAVMRSIRSASARCGISRIVVASSVHAERDDASADRYAQSKRGMENVALADEPGAPAVVLRLPPLYGAGARGAVRHIAKAVAAGVPLPLAFAKAPRRFLSLNALGAFCAVLVSLEESRFRAMAGRVWYPSSSEASSLAALARSLGGRHARLFPVPGVDLLFAGRVSAARLASERAAIVEATGLQPGD